MVSWSLPDCHFLSHGAESRSTQLSVFPLNDNALTRRASQREGREKARRSGWRPLTNSPSGQELLDDCSYGDAEEGDADCGMGADISCVPSAADARHYSYPAENLADGVLSYCRALLCLIKSDSVRLLAFGHSNDPLRATRNDVIKAFQGGWWGQGPAQLAEMSWLCWPLPGVASVFGGRCVGFLFIAPNCRG